MSTSALIELLADLAHRQWRGWMVYVFSKGTYNEDGSWTMPAEYVERWQRQMRTEYKDLSEEEQVSDRVEARKVVSVVEKHRIEDAIKKMKDVSKRSDHGR